MRAWVIDYYENDILGDCYPDFCFSREEAERIAPEFMKEPWMNWATRYEFREVELDARFGTLDP